MKECFKCKEIKKLNDYYKHSKMKDGHLNKYKECCKKDTSLNYRKNINHYRQYDRCRLDDEKRIKRNRENCKRLRRERPEKITKYNKRYREKYKERYKCNNALNNAIRDGNVKREPCIECGNSNSQAHHEDYSKPLNVIWLCQTHHKLRHRKSLIL